MRGAGRQGLAGSDGAGRLVTSLLLGSALVQATTLVVRPNVSYRAIELGVDPAVIGLIGATFAVVPLVVALPAGRMVDRFGEVRMMRLGGLLCLVATLLVATVGTAVWSLVLGTGLLGAGHLACVVGQQTLVATITPATRLDAASGSTRSRRRSVRR